MSDYVQDDSGPDALPIESFDQLVEHIERGAKPRSAWRIGTEYEKVAVRRSDGQAVPFSGPQGIEALLRRTRPPQVETLTFEDVVLDTRTHEVTRAGQPIELTARGFTLLEYFLRHPRQVLTREQIFRAIWGSDFLGASNVIDVNISYLRDRLEMYGDPRLIQTVRGVGYALREPPA